VSALATATARLEQFKNSPPDGRYSQGGLSGAVGVAFVAYQSRWGIYTAPPGYKYVTMSVMFVATSRTFVSSGDFTLLGIGGRTVDSDVCTYEFVTPFPTLALQAGTNAQGGLCFLVTQDFIPSKLVWAGYGERITVVMVLP